MFKLFTRGIEFLRQPDRNPRCYEMTDQERLNKIREWNNRNIWNDPTLTYEDQLAKELPKHTGHGHLGWTVSPATAKQLVNLIKQD